MGVVKICHCLMNIEFLLRGYGKISEIDGCDIFNVIISLNCIFEMLKMTLYSVYILPIIKY